MKRITAIILTMIMIVTFSACGIKREDVTTTETSATNAPTSTTAADIPATTTPDTDTPDAKTITPLLYKVSDKAGNCVWLFGSIHVGKDYFYPLPDYVLSAYNGADALAVECDIKAFESDLDAQTEAAMDLMYLDGSYITDYISEETYEVGKEALTEFGMYGSYMDMFKPIMWQSIIDSALVEKTGAKYDLGIDNYFLNDAYETGKKILEVESVEFQYNMLANFSTELQCTLLEDTLYYYENFDLYEAETKTMMELWENGDEDAFSEYLTAEAEFESEEEEKLYEEYKKAMETDRNIGMADFAEDALKSGEEVFICVGAAHVVGEGAMADLLEERGYTVEIIR